MRLLMALLQDRKARITEECLQIASTAWDVASAKDGQEALQKLRRERFDLLVLDGCLPKTDGHRVLDTLWGLKMPCPPRVLILSQLEFYNRSALRADCVAPLMAQPHQIAALLQILSTKPVPMLAAATQEIRLTMIEELLRDLKLRDSLKGKRYITWLLDHIIPSPLLEHGITAALYPACAAAYGTTSAAVERCVRHAVEEVFTRGSIRGIERYFGMTVDPERGKLTNRAFLIGAAEQLRARMEAATYSLTLARSPKSMEIHQSPAAPTSV